MTRLLENVRDLGRDLGLVDDRLDEADRWRRGAVARHEIPEQCGVIECGPRGRHRRLVGDQLGLPPGVDRRQRCDRILRGPKIVADLAYRPLPGQESKRGGDPVAASLHDDREIIDRGERAVGERPVDLPGELVHPRCGAAHASHGLFLGRYPLPAATVIGVTVSRPERRCGIR